MHTQGEPQQAKQPGFLDHSGLIFRVCALEVGNLVVALKVPDSGGHFVDQVFVVSDQKDGSLIALQRNVERVDRFEVEVVGRFVEHQARSVSAASACRKAVALLRRRKELRCACRRLRAEKASVPAGREFLRVDAPGSH